jgi:hypothetical protein
MRDFVISLLLATVFLITVAGCKSIRTPEVGSPSTPIVLGQPDLEQELPMLDLHPYGHKVETAMPILEPEKLIKVHIKGYTSDHSTYIGPHMVVIRVSPGYFVEPDGRHVPIPVAPELIEPPEAMPPEVQQKSEVIGQKERETQGAGQGAIQPAAPPAVQPAAPPTQTPAAGELSPQVREQIRKVREAFEAQELQ